MLKHTAVNNGPLGSALNRPQDRPDRPHNQVLLISPGSHFQVHDGTILLKGSIHAEPMRCDGKGFKGFYTLGFL